MRLTVAVCTYNRSALLGRTLQRMTELDIPQGLEWEILIVNNNCTDDTDAIVGEYCSRLPIRLLHQPLPGLSNARNLAMQNALGEYLLWTDDDVLVEKTWVTAYLGAFRAWPDAAIFGGAIRPWFPNRPPAWLPRALPKVEGAFAIRGFGEAMQPITDRLMPFGANVAFRRDILEQYPFDPSLGRKADKLLGGEETVVIQAMLTDGYKGWWVPGASVDHFIPPQRQTISYLRRYFEDQGEHAVRHSPSGTASWFGRPRWLWRQVVELEIKFWVRRVTSASDVWIEDLCRSSIARGQFRRYGQLMRRHVKNDRRI
jgi:glucosyl-dolichyl phosphate glucuronosyltransferase